MYILMVPEGTEQYGTQDANAATNTTSHYKKRQDSITNDIPVKDITRHPPLLTAEEHYKPRQPLSGHDS